MSITTSLGFPIACVVALAAFIWHIYKRSEKREDELRAEIKDNQVINAKMVETLSLYASNIEDIQTDINAIKNILLNE